MRRRSGYGRTSDDGRDRTVRLAGVLLCWAHAAAMALTCATAAVRPAASWWDAVWTGSWALTGVLLITWAVLRAGQKQRSRPCRNDHTSQDRKPPSTGQCPGRERSEEGFGQAA